jgi:hypothetical protein
MTSKPGGAHERLRVMLGRCVGGWGCPARRLGSGVVDIVGRDLTAVERVPRISWTTALLCLSAKSAEAGAAAVSCYSPS